MLPFISNTSASAYVFFLVTSLPLFYDQLLLSPFLVDKVESFFSLFSFYSVLLSVFPLPSHLCSLCFLVSLFLYLLLILSFCPFVYSPIVLAICHYIFMFIYISIVSYSCLDSSSVISFFPLRFSLFYFLLWIILIYFQRKQSFQHVLFLLEKKLCLPISHYILILNMF